MTATLRTVEMHTAGEPVRIVVAGWPEPVGDTLLARRRFATAHQDGLRRLLMAEPRGHAEMYGALLVPPDLPGADLAVLFMHNEGWSTMCGHAVLALARFAVDRGLVVACEPFTEVGIQCPCGLVRARVDVRAGRAGAASFTSVPAFVLARAAVLVTRAFGPLQVDVAYGGAFYAILPAAELGLDLATSPLERLVQAAMAVKAATAAQLTIAHPEAPELGFLYGTILTDGRDGIRTASTNICVFADGQVDRSPTGSGVTARLALLHRQGRIKVNETCRYRSITGGEFTGEVVATARCGPHPAVIVTVGGQAFYTGEASFTVEPDDPLRQGFLLWRR